MENKYLSNDAILQAANKIGQMKNVEFLIKRNTTFKTIKNDHLEITNLLIRVVLSRQIIIMHFVIHLRKIIQRLLNF